MVLHLQQRVLGPKSKHLDIGKKKKITKKKIRERSGFDGSGCRHVFNLQKHQLSGSLRCRAHKLQSFTPAAVIKSGLQEAHHGPEVCGLKETLDLFQRLTALQRLQPLVDLSPGERRSPKQGTVRDLLVDRIQSKFKTFLSKMLFESVTKMILKTIKWVQFHQENNQRTVNRLVS